MTYPAHYTKVTDDPGVLALMAEYDALLDVLYSKPSIDNATELAASRSFRAAHPEIQALIWAAEESGDP